jgi:multidrug efflux pump subunit AcrA (membrane-fusion protein)
VLAAIIARQIAIEGYKNLPPGYSLLAEAEKRKDVERAQEYLDKLKDQRELQHNISQEQIDTAQKSLDAAKAALVAYLQAKQAAEDIRKNSRSQGSGAPA